MPIYSNKGKTYNIPDDLSSSFEKKNPEATVSVIGGNGKYNIPVSKVEAFKSQFADNGFRYATADDSVLTDTAAKVQRIANNETAELLKPQNPEPQVESPTMPEATQQDTIAQPATPDPISPTPGTDKMQLSMNVAARKNKPIAEPIQDPLQAADDQFKAGKGVGGYMKAAELDSPVTAVQKAQQLQAQAKENVSPETAATAAEVLGSQMKDLIAKYNNFEQEVPEVDEERPAYSNYIDAKPRYNPDGTLTPESLSQQIEDKRKSKEDLYDKQLNFAMQNALTAVNRSINDQKQKDKGQSWISNSINAFANSFKEQDNSVSLNKFGQGYRDLMANTTLNSLANKIEREGEESLTEKERDVLAAFTMKFASEQLINENLTLSQKAGSGVADMISFMLEIASGQGMSKGILSALNIGSSKLATKYVAKQVGKNALVNASKRRIFQFGDIAADVAKTGTTMTPFTPAMYNEMQKQWTGNPIADTAKIEKEGRFEFDKFNDQAGTVEGAYKGIALAAAENISELSGAMFGYAIGKAGKAIKIKTPLKLKSALPYSNQIHEFMRNSQLENLTKGLKQAGWNGTAEEYLEEVANNVLAGALTADPELIGQLAEPDFHKTVLATTMLATVPIHMPNFIHGANRTMKLNKIRKDYENSLSVLESALGEENTIAFVNSLSEAPLEVRQQMLENVLKGDRTNEKMALAEYITNSIKYQSAIGGIHWNLVQRAEKRIEDDRSKYAKEGATLKGSNNRYVVEYSVPKGIRLTGEIDSKFEHAIASMVDEDYSGSGIPIGESGTIIDGVEVTEDGQVIPNKDILIVKTNTGARLQISRSVFEEAESIADQPITKVRDFNMELQNAKNAVDFKNPEDMDEEERLWYDSMQILRGKNQPQPTAPDVQPTAPETQPEAALNQEELQPTAPEVQPTVSEVQPEIQPNTPEVQPEVQPNAPEVQTEAQPNVPSIPSNVRLEGHQEFPDYGIIIWGQNNPSATGEWVGGHIAMDQEGDIDWENTDNTLWIRDFSEDSKGSIRPISKQEFLDKYDLAFVPLKAELAGQQPVANTASPLQGMTGRDYVAQAKAEAGENVQQLDAVLKTKQQELNDVLIARWDAMNIMPDSPQKEQFKAETRQLQQDLAAVTVAIQTITGKQTYGDEMQTEQQPVTPEAEQTEVASEEVPPLQEPITPVTEEIPQEPEVQPEPIIENEATIEQPTVAETEQPTAEIEQPTIEDIQPIEEDPTNNVTEPEETTQMPENATETVTEEEPTVWENPLQGKTANEYYADLQSKTKDKETIVSTLDNAYVSLFEEAQRVRTAMQEEQDDIEQQRLAYEYGDLMIAATDVQKLRDKAKKLPESEPIVQDGTLIDPEGEFSAEIPDEATQAELDVISANEADFEEEYRSTLESNDPIAYAQWVLDNSENPLEIAEAIKDAKKYEQEVNGIHSDSKLGQLDGLKIREADYKHYGDKNHVGNNIARTWFDNSAMPLDVIAQELGLEIQEIIDYINENPGGRKKTTGVISKLNTRFGELYEQITGKKPKKRVTSGSKEGLSFIEDFKMGLYSAPTSNQKNTPTPEKSENKAPKKKTIKEREAELETIAAEPITKEEIEALEYSPYSKSDYYEEQKKLALEALNMSEEELESVDNFDQKTALRWATELVYEERGMLPFEAERFVRGENRPFRAVPLKAEDKREVSKQEILEFAKRIERDSELSWQEQMQWKMGAEYAKTYFWRKEQKEAPLVPPAPELLAFEEKWYNAFASRVIKAEKEEKEVQQMRAENEALQERLDKYLEEKKARETAEAKDLEITEVDINNSDFDDVSKSAALEYLNGNKNDLNTIFYNAIKHQINVQRRSRNTEPDSRDNQNEIPGNEETLPNDGRADGSSTGSNVLPDNGGSSNSIPDTGERSETSSDASPLPNGNVSGKGSDISLPKTESDNVDTGSSKPRRSDKNGNDGVHDIRSDKGKPSEPDNRADRSRSDSPATVEGTDIEIDDELAAARAELKAAIDEFIKAGKENLSMSLIGINGQQAVAIAKIIAVGAKYGYILIKKGVDNYKKWAETIKSYIKDPLMTNGLTEESVNALIPQMWDMSIPNEEGVFKPVKVWAQELGMKRTKELVETEAKRAFNAQQKVNGAKPNFMDRADIDETLPMLLPEQRDDVYKAERRFFSADHQTRELAYGKGMMFTNGTGTGKTFTGMGIVARMWNSGKKRILIITPNQSINENWLKTAGNFNIPIKLLESTKDRGSDEHVAVTTYANFAQNIAILENTYDLVVYDESHKLMEEKSGAESQRTKQHYLLTNKSVDSVRLKKLYINPKWIEANEIENNTDLTSEQSERISKLREQAHKEVDAIPVESLQREVSTTKVIFLSATPFKAHLNLRYAESYLFSYPKENEVSGYRMTPEIQYMIRNFGAGYNFRYGRLESSVQNAEILANQELLWAENMFDKGVMSTRMLNSEMDYSRDFPNIAGVNTQLINDAYNTVYDYNESNPYRPLIESFNKVFHNYNFTTSLLEIFKASAALERIQQHLDLGRQVVIFHRRVVKEATPPFATGLDLAKAELAELIEGAQMNNDPDNKKVAELSRAISLFEEKFTSLLEYEQTLTYTPVPIIIKEHFGDDKVVLFNGSVNTNKKTTDAKVADFNKGKKRIFVVQEDAGKEGISLHDTTGEAQRVLINLALPNSSITALQIEGRIYRIGNRSNAIYEYPLLGLNFEISHFGSNLNRKLSTTENMAMGNAARDLLSSFSSGIINSSREVDLATQGIGGKATDRSKAAITPYTEAKANYFNTEKKTQATKSQEGADFFPTPDPVGLKMVQWLNIKPNDDILEPSAGQGNIARYIPRIANSTVIEPSSTLNSRLQVLAGGGSRRVLQQNFEDFALQNKFEGIAMNPPFGSQSKLAGEHVEKAFKHLRDGGRIVAIVPTGTSMEKRLDNFLYGKDEKERPLNPKAVLVAEILMPPVMFERAATSVSTKVIVIDKVPETYQKNTEPTKKLDLRDIKDINELFDRIEDMEMPKRVEIEQDKTIEQVQSQMESNPEPRQESKLDKEAKTSFTKDDFVTNKIQHTIKKTDLYTVKLSNNVPRDLFDKANKAVKANDGYYSGFVKSWVFEKKENLDKFLTQMTGEESDVRFRMTTPITPTNNVAQLTALAKSFAKQIGVDITILRGHHYFKTEINGKEYKGAPSGFYLIRTGEIDIYIDNMMDEDAVIATILHEAIGHKGIYDLIGKDNVPSFMKKVFDSMSEDMKQAVRENAAERHVENISVAMEEYIAELAETNPKLKFFDRMAAMVRDWFRDRGYNVNFTKNDLVYLLIKSRNILKNTSSVASLFNDLKLREGLHLVPSVHVKSMRERAHEVISPKVQHAADVAATRLEHKTHGLEVNSTEFLQAYREAQRDILNYYGFIKDQGDLNQHEEVELNKEILYNQLIEESLNDQINEEARFKTKLVEPIEYPADADIMEKLAISEAMKEIDKQARRSYSKKVKTDVLRAAHQDSQIALKRAEDLVANAHGMKQLPIEYSAYQTNTTVSSIQSSKQQDFINFYFNPLLKASEAIGTKEEVNFYLISKHALERNEKRRIQLYSELEAKINDYLDNQRELRDLRINSVNYDIEMLETRIEEARKIGLDTKALEAQLKEAVKTAKQVTKNANDLFDKQHSAAMKSLEKYGEKLQKMDFAGVSAIQEILGYEATNEQPLDEETVRNFVEEFESQHDTKDLWEKTRRVTNYWLDLEYKSGLIDPQMYMKLRSMYDYYVPLRGWDTETAGEVWDYYGKSSLGEMNNPIKKMKGRKTLADSVFANMGSMAEAAVFRAERNKLKQKLLAMATHFPTNLISVSQTYYVNTGTANNPDMQEVAYPIVGELDNQRLSDTEASAALASLTGQDKLATGKGSLKVEMPIRKYEIKEHQVEVFKDGKRYVLSFNGDPAAAQAITGKNKKPIDPKHAKVATGVTRWMKKNYTTRNPIFVLKNLWRDMQYISTMHYMRGKSPAYIARYIRNLSKASKGFIRYQRYLKGKKLNGAHLEIDKVVKEFYDNGGQTGWVQVNTLDGYKDLIAKEIKDWNRSKVHPLAMLKVVTNGIEYLSQWSEDIGRIATFMTSRDAGLSMEQSIMDAKEASTNFNRSGSGHLWQSWMNVAYFFYNANIQGLHNYLREAKHHPIRFMTTSTMLAFTPIMTVALAMMAGYACGEDDEFIKESYLKLPEHTRRNNLCLYKGDGDFVILPIPQAYRPVFSIGDIFISQLFGQASIMEAAKDLMVVMSDALPVSPLGGMATNDDPLQGLISTIAPDAFDPLLAVYMFNSSYSGFPISKAGMFDEQGMYRPEYQNVYDRTANMYIDASKTLNELSGGTIAEKGALDSQYLNPSIVQYLAESYLGGTYKAISGLIGMGYDTAVYGKPKSRSMPVVRDFFVSTKDRPNSGHVNEIYFAEKKRYDQYSTELRNYKKSVYSANVENPELVQGQYINRAEQVTNFVKIFNSFEKKIQQLSLLRNKVSSEEELRQINEQIFFMKKSCIEELEKAGYR